MESFEIKWRDKQRMIIMDSRKFDRRFPYPVSLRPPNVFASLRIEWHWKIQHNSFACKVLFGWDHDVANHIDSAAWRAIFRRRLESLLEKYDSACHWMSKRDTQSWNAIRFMISRESGIWPAGSEWRNRSEFSSNYSTWMPLHWLMCICGIQSHQ
jgi:hypothetical protein